MMAVVPMVEDTTEEAERSEVQPKDSIDQHQGKWEPATRNEPIRYLSPQGQVWTTTNGATEEQNHQRYKLDAEQTTVPDQYTLQGRQHPWCLELAL